MKKSLNNFLPFFNAMPDGGVIVDRKGKVLLVSDRVEKGLGYKKEELVGKNFLKTKIFSARAN